MNKIFFLSTCSTCSRIIKELDLHKKGFTFQDIKTEPITRQQLEGLKEKAGSYEALFSRVALKYRAMGLHEKKLTENDFKNLILSEYTFLKRPVIATGNKIFIGNSKNTIADAADAISQL